MKKEYSLDKAFSHLSEEEQAEIKALCEETGQHVEDLKVERKTYASVNKSEDEEISEEERWAIQYVSTRDVDSSGDVIIPKGVILSEYKKTGSPVFWGHDISMPPIGSDEWIKADDYGIKAKTIYGDTGEGTIADVVWRLVKQGHQKQSSVGIIPFEVVRRGDRDFPALEKELSDKWPEYKKNKKSVRRIIVKCLLFEHSNVGIGCNINTDVTAVSKAWTEAGADAELLKKAGIVEQVEELIKETKEVDPVEPEIEEEVEIEVVENPVPEVKRYVSVR